MNEFVGETTLKLRKLLNFKNCISLEKRSNIKNTILLLL